MKRLFVLIVALVMAGGLAWAAIDDVLETADEMHKAGEHEELISYLEGALGRARTNDERAEIYWRLSRAVMNLTENRLEAGMPTAEGLSGYEEGEAYADRAIEADPDNHWGYFWKSANVGKWGQTKGILNSLFKAGDMKDSLEKALEAFPKHPDSYFVLGQLYEQVPGFPVSFGDVDAAVSYGRLSVDLHEAEYEQGKTDEVAYDFYIELAKHLWARNWDERKRQNEHKKHARKYKRADAPLERGAHYEGTVDLKAMSDREEAEQIMDWVIEELSSIRNKTDGQKDDYKKAQETLAEW
jgi:tetratricopeptide (TPR) repeat protein